MKEIEFTQFLFPKGLPCRVLISVSDPVADAAEALKKRGFSLEIENRDGNVWAGITNHITNESVDAFCPNGPGIPGAINRMILEASRRFLCFK